jgi:hypothetical protein
MGTGKTTTAEFLTDQFRRNRIPAFFLAEGPTISEPIHPLRVSPEYPHPQAIWLDLTIEEFIEVSLQKWRDYRGIAGRSRVVTVCDGLLFHGNMTDLFLMNADKAVLERYIAYVVEILHDLDPVVIRFSPADLATALGSIAAERGPQWQTYQVNWKVHSPYGHQRSLSNFAGLVQLYHDYVAICDDISSSLMIPKLTLCMTGDWTTHYDEIMTFLDVPRLS